MPLSLYVHDIAFDFYNQRVATWSSDLTIKIYDYSEEERKWKNTASIKAHEGPIWRVQWADPAFGQVLVSCSADKSIKFFVEKEPETHKWTHAFQFTTLKEWSDVQFVPKRFGFILAACQKDSPGTLSVFGPSSRAMLDSCVVKAHADVNSNGWNALSWDPDASETNQMIVVGWKAPREEVSKEESRSGIQDLVKVYSYSGGKLNHIVNLWAEEGHTDSVTDVAWAPQNGRADNTIGRK